MAIWRWSYRIQSSIARRLAFRVLQNPKGCAELWEPSPALKFQALQILRKSLVSVKICCPAILGQEMAAPILWAPGILAFVLQENLHHAHKIPRFRGGYLYIRARPPGLIKHVLTVLLSGVGCLWCPTSRASFRSLKLCPWNSICFRGRSSKFLDLLPPTPLPPVQKRDAQHKFLQHKGGHSDIILGFFRWPRAVAYFQTKSCKIVSHSVAISVLSLGG